MPVKSGTVKIFLGNLSDSATPNDIRPLFEAYGKVVEADVIKNYGFVHMEDEDSAKRAIGSLNGKDVLGKPMVVELSTGLNKRGSRKGRCKIFVGNLHKDTQVEELRNLFAVHGTVVEADIISNYAFVHMETEEQARTAIEQLNGYQLHGQDLRVQMSTSSVRQVPGMDKVDLCYRCGSHGHWSKDCARYGRDSGYGPPSSSSPWSSYQSSSPRDRGRYAPYPSYAPPPPSYRRDPYYDLPRRDPYYEDRYYDPYDDYDLYDRRGARRSAPVPPIHDPYGPPPRHSSAEPLYDRRATYSDYAYARDRRW